MRPIEKIEINYFRSIYSISFSKTNDINILVGTNDVGKSNILKSLNLFFNDETELGSGFNFIEDLSRLREKEARAAKGRASIWIKITFNNYLSWASLPRQFVIKKSWNRYQSIPIQTIIPESIPNTTIARFINKISFNYIPAVRGRDIFSHYLQMLHDALIDDERAGVRGASGRLMEAINDSTSVMSRSIEDGLGFKSTIQVPEDLRELFAALDFSTDFAGYSVPLQKRGDGIQARHIPFILDFIATRSKKTHVWAYEEPENSLELGRAFELAGQFRNEFYKENQIFITTHSPAFYDLSGSPVTKWLINSEPVGPNNEPVTTSTMITSSDVSDKSLGVAALLADRARELHEEITGLRESNKSIESKLQIAQRPQVIVEGTTDQQILETAFSKLYPGTEAFCEFIPGNGASNIASFVKSHSKMKGSCEIATIALADNDQAGREQERKFSSYKYFDGSGFRVLNINRKTYFGLLPVPEELREVDQIFRALRGGDMRIPLSIELMFPERIINRAIELDHIQFGDRVTKARDPEFNFYVNLSENIAPQLPGEYAYFAKEIVNASKQIFADTVVDLEPDDFGCFQPLFETLRRIT